MTIDQNDLDYSDLLCFRMNALARKISRVHAKACAEYGITAGQSFILFDLLNNEGTNLTELAARVQLDNPAVSGYIDRLIKEELVIRVDDPRDRRLYRIYLTDKGRQLSENLFPRAREIHNKICELLNNDFADLFKHCLTKLENGI
jgi:DNA-binding MarR family transcriptional regulator